MISKKGFQLSVNMLVVIILGLVILGVGTSMFFSAFQEVTALREDVDSQSEARIKSLLDDGSIIGIPFSSKDGKRGDYVDFDLGINNELQGTYDFSVLITYAGSSNPDAGFIPIDENNIGQFVNGQIPQCVGESNSDLCGSAWVLKFDPIYLKKDETILNDDKEYFPIRIVVPKKNVVKGQYVFNVDVCYNMTASDDGCEIDANGEVSNRYGSREKLYITI